MAVRVAINGFGRIGRLAFRQMFQAEGYEVVAINDLTSPKMLAHLLKYDTTHGRYHGIVEADENSITVNGKKITIYAEKDAANLPWKDLKINLVGFVFLITLGYSKKASRIANNLVCCSGDKSFLLISSKSSTDLSSGNRLFRNRFVSAAMIHSS